MKMTDEVFDNRKLVKEGNASFIVLIPKKVGTCDINQYRPISLIRSLYKIVSKTLARKLKNVMNNWLINESQSAFIKGRNILKVVVVLNKAVEEAKKGYWCLRWISRKLMIPWTGAISWICYII